MTHPSLIKYHSNDLQTQNSRIKAPFIWNIILSGFALYVVAQFIF